MRRGSTSRAFWFALFTMVWAVTLVGVGPTLRAEAAVTWSPPAHLDSTSPAYLTGISCPTPTFCMAVDGFGMAVYFNGDTWSSPVVPVDDESSNLEVVSCPSSTFCVALDTAGGVLYYNGSTWTAPVSLGMSGYVDGVSCASSGFCGLVVGGNVSLYNGSSWSTPASFPHAVEAISCPSAGFCMAVDNSGHSYAYSGGTWGSGMIVTSGGDALSTVSCTSGSFCMTITTTGEAFAYNGSYWGSPMAVDLGQYMQFSVSCSSSSYCMAVDSNGNGIRYHQGTWDAPSLLDSDGLTDALSCATDSFCVAVDEGSAFKYDGSHWSAAELILVDPTELLSISCPTSGFCMAVDANGNVFKYSAGSWGVWYGVGIRQISCTSSTFCMGVTANGYAIKFNGTSWGTPMDADYSYPLYRVSCSSSSFCLAIDNREFVAKYDGASWAVTSLSPWMGPSGDLLSGVSCTSSSQCMVVSALGIGLEYNGTDWGRVYVDTFPVGFTTVTCTPSFCLASDTAGNIVKLTLPGYDATVTPLGMVPTSISCPSSSFCMAVDGAGEAFSFNGSTWSSATVIDHTPFGLHFLDAVACPSSSYCMAVDQGGNVLTYGSSVPPQPVVSSVTPTQGSTLGGTLVTVNGSGLAGATAVHFGSTLGTGVTVSSDSKLTVTSPAEAAAMVDITVTTSGGTSLTSANDHFTYVVNPLPVVASVAPNQGGSPGGTTVTVNGTHLLGATAVRFGSSLGTGISGVTDTQLTVVSPAGSGTVDVTVTTPDGTSLASSNDHFTYLRPAISSVIPGQGPLSGGTAVTVHGSDLHGATAVHFGNSLGTSITGNTDAQLTVTSPAGSGTVDVTVTTPDGTSAVSSADQFAYVANPTPIVSSAVPNQGTTLGGTLVTINGSDLTGATAVHFGIALGSGITVVNADQLTVTSPAGSGTVDVTVTTPDGTSATCANDHFSYVHYAVPVVSSVAPGAGPASGGQVVSVTGSGFMTGMTVSIGGVSATPTSITASTFKLTTPVVAAGYASVQVTTLGGPSAITPAAGYIFEGLGSYFPLAPFRILDTRSTSCIQCGHGALGPGVTRTVAITGVAGLRGGADPVPANATAVVVNVTAVGGTGSSLLTVYPNGTGRPLASNLNFAPGQVIANLVTVALGQSGAIDTQREVNIFNAVGTVNVLADVEGYFAPQASSNPAGEFHSMAPLRVCDTRVGAGITSNGCNQGHSSSNVLGSGQVVKVNVTGKPAGVPGSPATIPGDGTAGAVVLNLTAIGPTASTYVSVYPPQSNGVCTSGNGSSSLNVVAGQVQANRVIVPIGAWTSGGPSIAVCVFNASGKVNLVLDASGWFGSSAAGAPLGSQFQAIGPTRVCDTRSGSGTPCSGHAIGSGGTLTIAVTGVGGIPSTGPTAIIGNLTAIAGTASTYLFAYPGDVSPRPNGSDLNPGPGAVLPNLVAVGLSHAAPAGQVKLYNAAGTINAVLDVCGWFQ